METAIVTGASRGIGYALADLLLDKGFRVYGISRSVPEGLLRHANFSFLQADLTDADVASARLAKYFVQEQGLTNVRYLFLNAGMFGERIMRVSDMPLKDIEAVMDLNLWANKVVLDVLIRSHVAIDTCAVSASLASVRARAGNAGYAISKAALNMMIKLYALEHPSIFFALVALCTVKSDLSDHSMYPPADPAMFPDIAALQQRVQMPGYLATPEQRAADFYRVLSGPLRQHLVSGEFADIKKLLAMEEAAVA